MVIGNRGLEALVPTGSEIGPASVDMTLSDYILVPVQSSRAVRLGHRIQYKLVRFTDERPFILVPGAFVLAATRESFLLPDSVCGFVQGRSSIGRIGLTVQNAGFVDPGFIGTITLELVNEGRQPIALVPKYRIAQLVMLDVRDCDMPYQGKYNGQVKPTGSRMFMDKEVMK